MEQTLLEDSDLLVWYGTPAEIESAFCRKMREVPAQFEEIESASRRRTDIS